MKKGADSMVLYIIKIVKDFFLFVCLIFAFSGCRIQDYNIISDHNENNISDAPIRSNESLYYPKRIINLTPVCQYPELPTGCEVTALATVLQYYGFSADKCDLADNYLDKGAVGTVDFHTTFVGDPRSDYSYGCYAPAIVKAANKYLYEQDKELKAYDITGTDFEELFSYTDKSIPVLVWCTIDLKPGHYTTT